MQEIRIEHLAFSIGGRQILKDISLILGGHEFVGLIGPNGCGKSTLLKHSYRVNPIQSGQIFMDNVPMKEINLKNAAQKIAVMGQFNRMDFDFTVLDIALMGRTPYKKSFEDDTEEDYNMAREALERVGMWQARERSFNTLSGGEQQRVLLARALVQEPEYLILDEPTNHLDIKYQLELLKIVKGLGVGIVAALHDMNLAAAFCDRICVLKDGVIQKMGTPAEVVTVDTLRTVYGVESSVEVDEHHIPFVRYRVEPRAYGQLHVENSIHRGASIDGESSVSAGVSIQSASANVVAHRESL